MKALIFPLTVAVIMGTSAATAGPAVRTVSTPALVMATDGPLVLAQSCNFCSNHDDFVDSRKRAWRWFMWRNALAG